MKNASYITCMDNMAAAFETGKTHYAKAWIDNLNQLLDHRRPAILWGTGNWGMDCYDRFLRIAGIPIRYFCDNDPNKWGKQIVNGIACISPEEIKKNLNCVVIIAVNGHEAEISGQCQKMGVPEKNICIAPLYTTTWGANYIYSTNQDLYHKMLASVKQCLAYFENDQRSKELLLETLSWRLLGAKAPASHDGMQYFIPELPIRSNEMFVDAGAYTGDTLRDFAQNIPTAHDRIHYYAFECCESNLTVLKQALQENKYEFPVEVFPIALWDCAGELCFSDSKASSTIDSFGTGKVQANTLDDCLRNRAVSWIKMDIEGAEPQALAGCASIIREQKPRLSICTYHSADHLYWLPEYIYNLRNDYHMILRHHSWCDCETVLYAY